ncbi:unnamed protein product [Aspergillus oryzae]|uniref:Unnamed protein product n=2 Tax=Aspergillus oryzae TaxID=5062 RepID=A0AAN4YG35_ASPOZ|nr:unnamed protein product [Aspergillus oryzae]GMF88812.1 unnamed protein product [Aspergillus oryzae]GMG29187.1 unnamed protein product [Aspergillus oryzae]GMG45255.1 unnamed protein product [Aspergillus oryzae var. brunneus]
MPSVVHNQYSSTNFLDSVLLQGALHAVDSSALHDMTCGNSHPDYVFRAGLFGLVSTPLELKVGGSGGFMF